MLFVRETGLSTYADASTCGSVETHRVVKNGRGVEVFRRPIRGGHWIQNVAMAGQTITLHERTIAVDEIYGK